MGRVLRRRVFEQDAASRNERRDVLPVDPSPSGAPPPKEHSPRHGWVAGLSPVSARGGNGRDERDTRNMMGTVTVKLRSARPMPERRARASPATRRGGSQRAWPATNSTEVAAPRRQASARGQTAEASQRAGPARSSPRSLRRQARARGRQPTPPRSLHGGGKPGRVDGNELRRDRCTAKISPVYLIGQSSPKARVRTRCRLTQRTM